MQNSTFTGVIGSVFGLTTAFFIIVGTTADTEDNTSPQAVWVQEHVESTYAVKDVSVDFTEHGVPHVDSSSERPFVITGVSETTREPFELSATIDYEEQTVLLDGDAGGAVTLADSAADSDDTAQSADDTLEDS